MSDPIEERVTPEEMDKAALVTQLVCSTLNLDYAARALQAKRQFSGNAKRRLNLLVNASDAFLFEATKAFDMQDGTGTNVLSDVMMQVERMMLQCNPRQIEQCMHLLAGFIKTNQEIQ